MLDLPGFRREAINAADGADIDPAGQIFGDTSGIVARQSFRRGIADKMQTFSVRIVNPAQATAVRRQPQSSSVFQVQGGNESRGQAVLLRKGGESPSRVAHQTALIKT